MLLTKLVEFREGRVSGKFKWWTGVIDYKTTFRTCHPKLWKWKNIYIFSLKKFFLYFVKLNFLALRFKNLLYFTASTSKFFLEKNYLFFFRKITLWKNLWYFGKWNFLALKILIKLLYTLNKTPLGEKRCLSNLYYFVIYPFFNSTPFPNTVSQDTFGTLLLTAQCVTHVTYGTPCHANGHQVLSA